MSDASTTTEREHLLSEAQDLAMSIEQELLEGETDAFACLEDAVHLVNLLYRMLTIDRLKAMEK